MKEKFLNSAGLHYNRDLTVSTATCFLCFTVAPWDLAR